jgi:hypothetical protein
VGVEIGPLEVWNILVPTLLLVPLIFEEITFPKILCAARKYEAEEPSSGFQPYFLLSSRTSSSRTFSSPLSNHVWLGAKHRRTSVPMSDKTSVHAGVMSDTGNHL